MPLYRNKIVLAAAVFFAAVWFTLIFVQLDVRHRFAEQETGAETPVFKSADRDAWMNIFQKGRKIGFSHSILRRGGQGYQLSEDVFMRINTLGMVQDLDLRTRADLHPDMTLAAVEMDIVSGRFRFSVKGTVEDRTLRLETRTGGASKWFTLRLNDKPHMLAGILSAVHTTGLSEGEEATFPIFDPTSMAPQTIRIQMLGKETIRVMGKNRSARKISLNFKGSRQLAWIDENGDVLREHGLLGISMERTTREDARYGLPVESSEDLTRVASVEPDRTIDRPGEIQVLRLRIGGIGGMGMDLDGGRQRFDGTVLTIAKETTAGLGEGTPGAMPESFHADLQPTPFIQSDDPAIRKTVASIIAPDDPPLRRVRKIQDWIYRNIEKQPVLSLPDALSTLENRVGDCNEHAVLFAAMARAAGIPARVETGLVYLRGRFYYHAWNLLYLGQWITADSLFGQFPADATHLRLSGGETAQQLDLMGAIGNIKIEVLETRAPAPVGVDTTRTGKTP